MPCATACQKSSVPHRWQVSSLFVPLYHFQDFPGNRIPEPTFQDGRGVITSRQLIEQRLGLLEVGGVKALGEPAVDRGQQLAGLGSLALAAATGGSGSWRPAAPATSPAGGGRCRGPGENRFPPHRCCSVACCSSNSPLSRYSSASPEALPGVVHHRQRLGQHAQPLLCLSCFPIRLGQQGKIIRQCRLLPPWPGRRPGPGGSGQSPPLPVPARPAPSPAGSFPTPSRAQTPARSRGRWLPLPALGLPAPPGGTDGAWQHSPGQTPG